MTADFVPHHALVAAPNVSPARWMLVLHGILGSGANWRTFARRLADAQAEAAAAGAAPSPWGFILVDLRAHGASQGPPPPHTVAAAADDLLRLGDRIGLDIRGVMGHSFGGKVALAYLERRASMLDRCFLLDSDPSASPGGASDATSTRVLSLLRSLPQPMESRAAFLEAVQAAGHSRSIAEWLAMNVRREDDGFRFRLDLDVVGELLADYFARDLWHVLEDPPADGSDGAPPGGRHVHAVLGGRSTSISPAARDRFEALAARAPWFSVHVLPRAGHWLHADDPDGLFEVVRAALWRRAEAGDAGLEVIRAALWRRAEAGGSALCGSGSDVSMGRRSWRRAARRRARSALFASVELHPPGEDMRIATCMAPPGGAPDPGFSPPSNSTNRVRACASRPGM